MINWKKVKADGVTPARKKDLLVLWDLVRGRPKPTPPKLSEEDMDMDRGFDSEANKDLCEGDENNQVTSVLIYFFVSIVLIFANHQVFVSVDST